MPKPIYFLTLNRKTALFKLEDLFPECFLYREPSPRVEPLVCLAEDLACTAGHSCMGTLVQRLKVLFGELLPDTQLILLYFKKRNVPGMGAGVFWRDFREPRVFTVNLTAWERVKRRGAVFQFTPGESFFLTGQAADPTSAPASVSV